MSDLPKSHTSDLPTLDLNNLGMGVGDVENNLSVSHAELE